MNTAIVVIALMVVGIVAATIAIVVRERRDRAVAARLDEADPGAGVRAHADAERQQAGPRGEAGGMSWSAGGQNSA